MAQINIAAIARKGMVSKTAVRASLIKARTTYEAQKDVLFNEIDNHEVSRELEAEGTVGEYSLYGFLGFDAGRKPVSELKEYLETALILDETPIVSVAGKEATIGYKINIPAPSEVYKAMETLNWKGKKFSWVYGIERFIPGLEYFIWFIKEPKGRSGLGIQGKAETVSGSAPGAYISARKYVTTMLRSFAARIQSRRGGRFI